MIDDVISNKSETVERCVERVREVYRDHSKDFKSNFDAQDIVVLNLQRAVEACIDIASHIVRLKQLGAPQGSRDFYVLLEKTGLLSPQSSSRMQAMIGFRNIAIHDYQKMSIPIVISIIEKHLTDFSDFVSEINKIQN